MFAEARPPGIYKPDYIDALYAFYHEKKPEKVVCPPIPEWKRSSEFDLNGEAVPDDDDDGVPGPPLHVRITYEAHFGCFGFYHYFLHKNGFFEYHMSNKRSNMPGLFAFLK